MIIELIAAIILGLLFHGIHRKVIARLQRRPGPPVWQEILHTIKFAFKETWIPKTASQEMFVAIVLVAIAIWSLALYIGLSGGSLLLIFAIYLLHKIVEHGMGLSSGSPYGKFGAIRSVISASSEIPLLATVAVIYFFTGTLQISEIIAWQGVHGPLLILAFPAAIAMYVVVLSKMPYSPFGIIEAKELVSGNKTEHFGVWRAGLEVAFAIKTFVLLFIFVVIFVGALSPLVMFIAMLMLLLSFSYICSFSAMLSPYDAVTVQVLIISIIAIYILALGVVA